HEAEGARFEQVIRVQPTQDVARCPGEALDQRIGLAVVGLALPVCEVVSVSFEDRHGLVSRPTVYDDVFQVRVVLFDKALDRGFDEPPLVERGSHYGDPWPRFHFLSARKSVDLWSQPIEERFGPDVRG